MYRFEIPLRAMVARSWCSAAVYDAGDQRFDFAARHPFLMQRLNALNISIAQTLRDSECPIIHDIDDLLWSIPVDNWNAPFVTPEVLANMDAALKSADLVTASTEPLAFALERRGIMAVVIPNVLDWVDWQTAPRRSEHPRLRVGWCGQRDVHVEDLNILENVVTALEREVDFVFYGDMPQGLKSRRNEIENYASTAIDLFPAMLAALDLDILLAPLAKSEFNECKSNLRLLQAGMLGYAVIATDIEPHRTLPVTRVENTPAAWIRAIRERIGETQAIRADGIALQAAVSERYTLNDRWAERIYKTWTGCTSS